MARPLIHVCMVSYSSFARDSRLRREAQALSESGYAVDVVCLRRPEEPLRETRDGITIFRVPVVRYRGARVRRYLSGYGLFFLRAALRLLLLFLRRRYAMIQVHTPPDILIGVALPYKALGARLVLDVRDTTPELFASRFGVGRDSLPVRLLTLVERLATAIADHVLVVHEREREMLQARGVPPGKMTIVMNAADESLFNPALYDVPAHVVSTQEEAQQEFVVLYLGTILRRQGLDTLVRAVAQLAPELPALRVRIVGNGDYSDQLQNLIQTLGVEHIVRLESGVPYDRVPAEIAAADACVVPVNRDVFTDDILPVKLLEAVAMQRPVIASRISNIERHFDDRAICYSTPGDVGDLVRCLRTVATDAEYRQRLVAEAGRQAQPYRWAQVKPDYLTSIAGLIQAPALRRRASLVDSVGVPGSVHDESVR